MTTLRQVEARGAPASRPEPGSPLLAVGRRSLAQVPSILLLLALLGVWQIISMTGGLPAYVLPSPTSIVETALTAPGTFGPAAQVTLTEVAIGYLAAVVGGFVLASVMIHVRVLERALYPLIIATQSVPTLAIAPVLIIWFGFGQLPKVIVVFVFSFFPIVVTAIAGMRSVEQDMIVLMRTLGANRWSIFWRVRFPAGLPMMFTGLKQGAVYSTIGAVTAEWVGAEGGLGQVMITANSFLRTADVFAAILWLTTMAIGMFLLITVIERLTIGWYFLTKG